MNFLKKAKINYIIDDIVTAIIGVVLLFWPGATLNIMVMALAILLFAVGIIFIIGYFAAKERNIQNTAFLTLGLIIAVIGAWMFAQPTTFEAIVPIIAGLIIAAGGISNIAQGVTLHSYKYSNWWISLVFGIIAVIVGALLVINPLTAVAYVVQIIGISIIYNSVTNIWTVSRIAKYEKAVKQEIEAIDSEGEFIDK